MTDDKRKEEALTFAEFREAQQKRQSEWDPLNVITPEFRGNELAGEVGELCNILKKIARQRLGLRGGSNDILGLTEELADVIICADLIAMQFGVDLGQAVRAKFNATSDKYGLSVHIPAFALSERKGDAADEYLDAENKRDEEMMMNDPEKRPAERIGVEVKPVYLIELPGQKFFERDGVWCDNPDHAHRFATKEEAERKRQTMVNVNLYVVTEHIWENPPPSQPFLTGSKG